ncbi:MAG: SGNH/GDSL hydrolase family protein [Planctomycetota bacterium]
MKRESRSLLIKLAVSFPLFILLLEITSRIFLNDTKISPPATLEAYFNALGTHDTDRAAQKPQFGPKRGFRFVVLGDSTAVGFPYAPGLSFGSFIALGLSEATGTPCDWEVVGVAGRSSAGIINDLPLALESQADCFLLYIGHNEFAHRIANISPFGRAHNSFFDKTFAGMSNILWKLRNRPFKMDAKNGPPMFQSELANGYRLLQYGNTEERESGRLPVTELERKYHFERYQKNITTIVTELQKLKVPVIIIEPASNLLAAPLSSGKRYDSRAMDAYNRGMQQLPADPSKAREQLLLARELDPAPIRVTQPLKERLQAGAQGTQIVKIESDGIEHEFIDMVHPKPALAAKFAERIALQLPDGIPRLDKNKPGQLESFRAACARHLARPDVQSLIMDGDDLGVLLSAHMHLEYGNPGVSEKEILNILPKDRLFGMSIILDLALRWRSASAVANQQIHEILSIRPEWKPAIDWWLEQVDEK